MKMNWDENTKVGLNINQNIDENINPEGSQDCCNTVDKEAGHSCCKNGKHNPSKHMFHMILCCGIPIAIVALLPFVARYSLGAAALLGFIAPFICPIMMGGMIFMMFKKSK